MNDFNVEKASLFYLSAQTSSNRLKPFTFLQCSDLPKIKPAQTIHIFTVFWFTKDPSCNRNWPFLKSPREGNFRTFKTVPAYLIPIVVTRGIPKSSSSSSISSSSCKTREHSRSNRKKLNWINRIPNVQI